MALALALALARERALHDLLRGVLAARAERPDHDLVTDGEVARGQPRVLLPGGVDPCLVVERVRVLVAVLAADREPRVGGLGDRAALAHDGHVRAVALLDRHFTMEAATQEAAPQESLLEALAPGLRRRRGGVARRGRRGRNRGGPDHTAARTREADGECADDDAAPDAA